MAYRDTQRSGLLERIAHASPKETPDLRDILSSLGEVVYDWNILTDRLRWGPNFEEVLGFASARTIETGAAYADRIAPESGVARHEAVTHSGESDAGSGVRYQIHYGLLPHQGAQSCVWVEDAGRWFGGPTGRPARAHGVVRLVARGSETGPRPPVHHDPLTGALSRARFAELTGRMFSDATRNRSQYGLMLIAVDGLSTINQLYGYTIADQLIAGLARNLAGCLRASDLIARYAGGKFAIALAGCDSEQLAVAAKRCIDAVAAEPLTTDIGSLRAAVRIGGVVAPRHAATHHSVYLHAEEALEIARSPGSPRFVPYEPSFAREGARQQARRISGQIIAALNDRRIAIAFEPIVDAATGRPAFHEALMRMRLEDGSLVSPAVVFPVAEKTGLAPLLDQRVLELALAHLANDPSLSLSVNMSGLTTRDPDWPERTRCGLARYPGCAERLIIEITETCVIEDLEATRRTVSLLKGLGVRVAMDDFGAGHTSFRNLRGLQLDFVKIDGAFVQNLARCPDDRFFVRTLIELARHVGIPTVAEWVEDEDTARLLKEWGVAYFQGALFGRAGEPEPDQRADRAGAAA